MYGELKRDLAEILKKLCEMKQVQIIEGKVCKDHIHMYVAIPPKMSVSDFMAYLKGKSTLMLFDRHPEYRQKWTDRHFWARGYYVSTVGNVNEETIIQYIKEQEENDKLEDGKKWQCLQRRLTVQMVLRTPANWRNQRNALDGLKSNPRLKWGFVT